MPQDHQRYACVTVLGSPSPTLDICVERLRATDITILGIGELPAWLPEPIAGVALLVGDPTTDWQARIRQVRRTWPSSSILVISPPPSVTSPLICGWIALESRMDLAAAIRVAATGGAVGERGVRLLA